MPGAENEDIMAARTITKAFLIYPPTGLYDRFDRCQAPLESETVFMIRPPMDLAYMAAALEKVGVECRIHDYPAEINGWDSLERDLKSFSPDILIASTIVPTFEADCRAFQLAKSIDRDMLTVAKGVISVDDGEIELTRHPEIDIIVRGEPEFTVAEIARGDELHHIQGITYRDGSTIHVNLPRPDLENLDRLHFPARHLLNNDLYRMPDNGRRMGIVLTSKGCPYDCIFCLVGKVYGKKVIFRSPASLAAEIEQCVKEYDIHDFWFRSDTFTMNKRWVLDVCRLMIEKHFPIRWATNSRVDTIDDERLDWMKKAGCFAIGFGIESGSQEILNRVKKGITLDQCHHAVRLCKEKGILTYLFYMIGLPWDSRETIRQTVAFAKELDGDISNFSIAYPFTDSELYRIALDNGLIKSGQEIRGDYSKPAIPTLYLTRAEVARLEKWANRALLLRPRYIARTLARQRSLTSLKNYISAGLRMLRYSLKTDM